MVGTAQTCPKMMSHSIHKESTTPMTIIHKIVNDTGLLHTHPHTVHAYTNCPGDENEGCLEHNLRAKRAHKINARVQQGEAYNEPHPMCKHHNYTCPHYTILQRKHGPTPHSKSDTTTRCQTVRKQASNIAHHHSRERMKITTTRTHPHILPHEPTSQ